MTCGELERYLRDSIPLTAAADFTVVAVEPSVVLSAPLAPNLNHQGTAFGGSIAMLGITACWAWLRLRVSPEFDIVIKSSEIDYLAPARSDFEASCVAPAEPDMDQFLAKLSKKGRAGITVEAKIDCEGVTCARFRGVFVALPSSW